jgi:hypothetical protein
MVLQRFRSPNCSGLIADHLLYYVQREYEEFKVRINALVAKAQKVPEEGWTMQDGTPWPGNSTRDHPGMIQVKCITTPASCFHSPYPPPSPHRNFPYGCLFSAANTKNSGLLC